MGTVLLSAALDVLGIKATVERAEFELPSAASPISLNDDGVTWSKIPGMVGSSLNGFSVTDGTLTKISSGSKFLVNGVSDLKVNKACTIFYGLSINGSVVSGQITEHTFTSTSKIENISITAIADISIDDEIEIWAKGDGVISGVQLTPVKLDVTFWGE